MLGRRKALTPPIHHSCLISDCNAAGKAGMVSRISPYKKGEMQTLFIRVLGTYTSGRIAWLPTTATTGDRLGVRLLTRKPGTAYAPDL